MRKSDLERMHAVETDHWWFVGKRRLFMRLLEDELPRASTIMDVGSGTGATALAFARYGNVIAMDSSQVALSLARERGLESVVAGSVDAIPCRDSSVDLVLAFDVIEHVDDDRGSLEECARVLRPGGVLAIHVPAWPFLWSEHDEVLGHRRRYTRATLEDLVDKSTLTLRQVGWSGASLLPIAILLRLSKRALRALTRRRRGASNALPAAEIFELPGILNLLATRVLVAEASLAATVGLPFGLSLWALARKPRDEDEEG